ncbi:translation initiation factor IF-2-like [Triticum dicoccoides]|uniref:translation initiation factor IF-2-like n=1 Tax=Triticum dicoccoides TaxID=85692 RepID=UPI000E7C7F3B|nr:translation initiation factor IF-2-like [Triticum dicoccoides]
MATVTPGVLLRLLQAMHTDERVTGEHRSPALQVTAVVPALTASTADSLLCPSNGFLLQLSDGLHSTYVQPSPADADALLSARPHIVGHLVHLDRLRFASPIPRAVGLRPVPSSRSLPCVGNPEPLIVRSAACSRGYVIRPDSSPDAAPPLMPSGSGGAPPSDATDAAVKRTVLAPRNGPEAAALPGGSAAKRRFSSPAPAKQRDPSPAVKGASRAASPSVKGASRASSPAVRGTSRSSSPAPSKCVVPSLVAAKEENRRVAKEPAIIVPSRYRQPSPGGRRGAASPGGGGRRGSLSPGSRRLSGEGGSKKKVGVLVSGISKMTDLGSGSAMKPGRKSWDESAMALAAAAAGTVKKSKVKVDRDTILRTQEAMSRRLSDATTELSSNDDSSVDEKPKPRKKTESTAGKAKAAAPKITLHDAKWTDGSIPLVAVSDKLSKIGKEAAERRDAAAAAAADALQEALITDSVIRNLSKFSELCSLSKTANPLPTVDCFLAVYEDTLKWKKIAESMATNGADEAAFWEKSATHWVEAALATELEVLKLVNSATGSIYQKNSATAVEPPRTSLSKRPSLGASAKVQSRASPLPAAWPKTPGMNETVELANTLCREMHVWFLKFVNEAMDVGFHLFEDQNIATRGNQSGHITVVLSQFKRISDWLDGVGKIADEDATKDNVERLKRKIYQFVISRMGSAFESSVSVSAKS